MDTSIYQEIILDHVKHPRNKGELAHATHRAQKLNSSCGDQIAFDAVLHNDTIAEIAWHGNGCAISTAAASVLSEKIKGLTIAQAQKITDQDIKQELGLADLAPTREKCLHIALHTFHALLQSAGKNKIGI